MIDLIKKCLLAMPVIADWSIVHSLKSREELYLIFNETEALRSVEEESYNITIYINSEDDGRKQTGRGTVAFNRTITETDLMTQLEAAVFSAGLALNPFYTISDREDNTLKYEQCDPQIAADTRAVIKNLQSRLQAKFAANPDVRCASAEIFVTKRQSRLLTSRGVEHQIDSTSVMLEAVILTGEGEKEVESNLNRSETFLSVLDIDNLLDRYIGYARENIHARLPLSGRYPVIFTEEALDTFFEYHTAQVSGGMLYNRMNKFSVGETMVKDAAGDKLTLSFDPVLPGGEQTGKYDGYGTLREKFTAIEDNIFKKIVADKKYADYLKCPATGSAGNVVVHTGSRTFEQLLEDGCFILSRFSAFAPRSSTGAFSGEIRNGLFYKNGTFQPVKGGSVTGKMDEAFQNVYFSSETCQRGAYYGPRYIKIGELDIAGD